jgi:hypothetical protein
MEVAVDGGKILEEPKILIKVLSEKLASTEGLKQALGPIWCPIRGIKCSRRGENIFMITLLQTSGKKKALDNGPWMFNNDLVVVEEYDPMKSVEDYKFSEVPIWIRILKLPLGKMNKATGEMIGERVGECLEVDVGEDDLATGEYLRIKVRINITKALMRGMMIQVGEEGRSKWCPFEYEFLPEFCYNCGIIGHDDKCCPVQIKKGEEKQFGSWLRAFIPKKQNSSERQRWSGGGGSGSGGRSYEFGDRRGTTGSNSFSWRKEESNKMASENSNREDREQEVTSPLKRTTKKTVEGNSDGPRRTLDWDASSERKEQEETKGDKRTIQTQSLLEDQARVERSMVLEGKGTTHVLAKPEAVESRVEATEKNRESKEYVTEKKKKNTERGNTFRRRSRTKEGNNDEMRVKLGEKRSPEQMEIDDEEKQMAKKGKMEVEGNSPSEAGLSEQPCESQ